MSKELEKPITQPLAVGLQEAARLLGISKDFMIF